MVPREARGLEFRGAYLQDVLLNPRAIVERALFRIHAHMREGLSAREACIRYLRESGSDDDLQAWVARDDMGSVLRALETAAARLPRR